MRKILALLFAVIIFAAFGLPASGVFAEDSDGAAAVNAAEVAQQLRNGVTDVTGNGIGDESDALAQLMHITGSIPDFGELRLILKESLLGEKYLDKFSYTGTVSQSGFYRSDTISYSLSRVKESNLIYYVADIYLRDIGHFRTAFPETGYGTVQSVKKMAKAYHAIVAINGDYYSAQDTTGIVVRNGVFYSEHIASRKDICALYADGTMEVYEANDADIDTFYDKQSLHVWQFGPALLNADGTSKSGSKAFNSSLYGANPRTVLGYYEPGHYCFVVVEGRGEENSDGLNLTNLSKLMERLGCTQAYNLDGGGSSVMADEDGVLNTPSSSRKCSDILFIVDDYTTLPDMEEE